MLLTGDYTRIAATFTRLQTILKGLEPDVDTIGIITAWNPMGEKASREFNAKANAQLLKDLREYGLGPIKVGGYFEKNLEGSFLIPNMDRDLLIELCKKYDQWGVIYGDKFETKRGEVGFVFEVLGPDGEQRATKETVVLTSQHTPVGHEDVGELKDNFGFFRGRTPKPSKIPGQPAPTEKRFRMPFRFPKPKDPEPQ